MADEEILLGPVRAIPYNPKHYFSPEDESALMQSFKAINNEEQIGRKLNRTPKEFVAEIGWRVFTEDCLEREARGDEEENKSPNDGRARALFDKYVDDEVYYESKRISKRLEDEHKKWGYDDEEFRQRMEISHRGLREGILHMIVKNAIDIMKRTYATTEKGGKGFYRLDENIRVPLGEPVER